jgi:hypothetical protein
VKIDELVSAVLDDLECQERYLTADDEEWLMDRLIKFSFAELAREVIVLIDTAAGVRRIATLVRKGYTEDEALELVQLQIRDARA